LLTSGLRGPSSHGARCWPVRSDRKKEEFAARGSRNKRRVNEAGEANAVDYAKPTEVVGSMIARGSYKLTLEPRDLLVRGALAMRPQVPAE
jgi:hypothetical protein